MQEGAQGARRGAERRKEARPGAGRGRWGQRAARACRSRSVRIGIGSDDSAMSKAPRPWRGVPPAALLGLPGMLASPNPPA